MPDPIKPTAADREAAWPFMARITNQYGDQIYEKSCLGFGWYDDNHYVQAFALHAQQAREQALEEAAVVKDCLTPEQLDKSVELCVVRWEGRLHCAYLNDFRVVGGKPWGGGSTEKAWNTSLREIIRAFPELQKALGFNYLGQPIRTLKEQPPC